MSTKLEELEQQARALSREERAKLSEMLLESLREGPIVDIEAARGARNPRAGGSLRPGRAANCFGRRSVC